MDLNSSFNKSLNSSGTYENFSPHQNMAGTAFTQEQLMALQQMQLNAQMGNLTLTNGLQGNLSPVINVTSPYMFPALPNLLQSTSGLMPGGLPILPQYPTMPLPQTSPDGQPFPQAIPAGQSFQPPPIDPSQQLQLFLQLHNNIPSAVNLRKTIRQNLDSNQEEDEENTTQSPQISTPLNGSSPNTPNSSARRQLILSETSSNTSSGPASPASGIGLPLASLSDYSPGPNSPKSPVFCRTNSEPQASSTPKTQTTRGSSLKYETRYPQDQCYRCMKKVYPLEKIGPIKDVVYHKGCFTCKTCGTKLNLKNFCHNKNEDWDIHVYCKSHCDQGLPQPVHLDANSLAIKGALSTPKLTKVNEQIRGDDETHRGGKLDANAVNIRAALSAPKREEQRHHDGRYHIDLQSLEIAHARNVPATDLQTGNRIKQQAWRREERKSENSPRADVKYSDKVPEYDMDSYNKLQVENNPDYDR